MKLGLLKSAMILLLREAQVISTADIESELKRAEELEDRATVLLEKFYSIKKNNDDYEKTLNGLQERLDNLVATVSRFE